MKKDRLGDKARAQHILLAIQEIKNYTKDVDFEGFSQNSMMLQATIRQLEIIGEASNRLTEELLQANPQVEWAKIVGMRNMLIHEYFSVNPLIIWEIIQNNIPVFEQQIADILATLS